MQQKIKGRCFDFGVIILSAANEPFLMGKQGRGGLGGGNYIIVGGGGER